MTFFFNTIEIIDILYLLNVVSIKQGVPRVFRHVKSLRRAIEITLDTLQLKINPNTVGHHEYWKW